MQQPPGQPPGSWGQHPYGQPPNPQQVYGQAYAPHPGAPPGMTPYDPAEVQHRLKKLNNQSLAWGVPGLILQSVGSLGGESLGGASGLVWLLGTGLLIRGLALYAQSRGHHWAFAFLGLFSCLGMIVLALLPKKCIVCGGSSKAGACVRCYAPVAQ